MKANKHYVSKDPLEIMDMKIKSRCCTEISIKFTIDARHILLAIANLSEEEKAKPSRRNIENQIRRELYIYGEGWYSQPIDYGEEGRHYDLAEELKKVLPVGKKLFPEFFDTPNSVKFIKDLA